MNSKDAKKPTQKSAFREWLDSVLFAVVAATLIRFFLFEAYTIPTPSMESSLMVGDFLFVSKMHYGVRTPKTPLQLPLTHQKIWFTNIPSYLRWLNLPTLRLPGFTEVKKGDAVVFNAPNWEDDGDAPLDLRTFYVKRCVGTPGDVIEVRNQQVLINNKALENPERMQHPVFMKTKETLEESFFDQFGIRNSPDASFDSADWLPLADSLNQLVGYKLNTSQLKISEISKSSFAKSFDYDSFKDILSNYDSENMSILSLNICSLNGKINSLRILLDDLNNNDVYPSIIALQETWTTKTTNLKELNLKGYELIVNSRSINKGGGIGMYINENLDFNIVENLTVMKEKKFESIVIEIKLEENTLCVGNFYRSSSDSHKVDFFETFEDWIGNISDKIFIKN